MEITLGGLMVLTFALEVLSTAEDSVHLKDNKSFKTTSSTLKWMRPSVAGHVPKDAVVGSVNYGPINPVDDMLSLNITDPSQLRQVKIYVCRAFLNGNWVPGAVFEHSDVCIVSSVEKVFERKDYDVLVNVDEAARLRWMNWDHSELPTGTVSAGEYYIAHSPSPKLIVRTEDIAIGMTYRIGKIDPYEGLYGKMSVVNEDKNVVNDVQEGQVLVETEPILYELTVNSLTVSRAKILKQNVMKLGEVTLRNDGDRQMYAESVIIYSWEYESYWGHGKAMSKGLETRIQFRNSTPIETVRWGIITNHTNSREQNVNILLEAGTASHVSVEGVYEEIEIPYTGTLLSVFVDNHTMKRTINDVWRYTNVTDIRIEYGPLYFVVNNSVVPTTTTTTTAVMTARTTTEASLPTNVQTTTLANEKLTLLPAKDNEIEDDDNSDALQLKNKANSDKNPNSACKIIFLSQFSALIPVLAVSVYNVYVLHIIT